MFCGTARETKIKYVCGMQGNSGSQVQRSGSRRANRKVPKRAHNSSTEEACDADATFYTPLDTDLLESLTASSAPNAPLKPAWASGHRHSGSAAVTSKLSSSNVNGEASTATVSRSTTLNLNKHRRKDGNSSNVAREEEAEVTTTMDEIKIPQKTKHRKRHRKKRSGDAAASPEAWRALNEVRLNNTPIAAHHS